MNLTIVSMFRDSVKNIDTYKRQVLEQEGFDNIQCCWVEGDSKDDTFAALEAISGECNAMVFKQDTGSPRWGSVESRDRFAHLGRIGNFMRQSTLCMKPTDFVVYVESDLLIRDKRLFYNLATHNVDLVCPIIYKGDLFYDTWGFLDQDGNRWSARRPYSHYLAGDGLCPMKSAGSCIMMKWKVWEETVWGDEAFRSFCADTLSKGYKIWVDKNLSIYHP